MTIKRQSLHLLQRILYLSGLAIIYRLLVKPEGAMILMYHSVVDKKIAPFIDNNYSVSSADFELQIQFLKQHCNVISMSDLLCKMDNNENIPSNTAVITFDDGYLNNLEIAAPILKKYQLPATLFLCTGYVTRSEPQWVDHLQSLLRFRSCDKIKDSNNNSYDLSHHLEYKNFYSVTSNQLLTFSAARREQLLCSINKQLKPSTELPKLTMNWDDVRLLKKDYPLFELGLHSHDHLDLSALDLPQLKQELSLCVNSFEQQMGYKAQFFSYPFGRHSENIALQVKKIGLKGAVITQPAHSVTVTQHRYMMPRYEVTNSLLDLKLWMSGAFPMLAKKILRRVYE